jgi:energy-coupling factor transport system ATP-binding protein
VDAGTPFADGTRSESPPAARDDHLIVDLQDLHYGYEAASPVLRGLDLSLRPGETCAVVGANGSGKSTLARILCGLQGGARAEHALVLGCDLTSEKGRRDARRHAGVLFQDPESQLIGATVEDDVAFGLENLGETPERMAARVGEMLARFGLSALRTREPHELSGGQKQRVALAGVLAIPRRLLVLDEPTAMLDAEGRREVLAVLSELREQDPGMTIVFITQEMDELSPADRVVALADGKLAYDGPPGPLLSDVGSLQRLDLEAPLAVQVAGLLTAGGRRFEPLPLTVGALADSLRGQGERTPDPVVVTEPEGSSAPDPEADSPASADSSRGGDGSRGAAFGGETGTSSGISDPAAPRLACAGLSYSYRTGAEAQQAVAGVDLDLPPGSATALLGPSGAGKSTLLLLLRGLLTPAAGSVRLNGQPVGAKEQEGLRRVGLVFQRAEIQLFAQSAWDDVAFGPRQLGDSDGRVRAAVDEAMELVGLPSDAFGGRHPHALSTGEQRRLALAGVLAMRPGVLLLDEPFVGLDPAGRRTLLEVLQALGKRGITLLLATHDAGAAWALCPRRVVMDGGSVVADGPWEFGGGGLKTLEDHGIEAPPTVALWRRLGRPLDDVPRDATAVAEALA